jgi:signal transduction histidine kinase
VAFADPHQARRSGIETVYQDLALIDDLTVWQNFFLGNELTRALGPLRLLDRRGMRRTSQELLSRFVVDVPVATARVRRLSGGQRQAVAIARAASWGNKIVIMDEPAAALGVQGTEEVEAMIDSLKSEGIAVLLISHNLDQVLRLADQVWVLRSGRAVASRRATETSGDELVGLITGVIEEQLVDAARRAGMAEIAVNVLHNVGNVLNSVNVSTNLVLQKVRGSKSAGLGKAAALIGAHPDDLADFLTTDPRGRALPGYLSTLAEALVTERDSVEEELLRLTDAVSHIREIVRAQQSLAGARPPGVIEPVRIDALLEDALRMAGALGDDDLTVTRVFSDTASLSLDKHRVLLVLVNLIANALSAMKETGRPRWLDLTATVTAGPAVSISVADNGDGISPENLTRIYAHGFTTREGGHGFGLHSSALAAREMGGALTVHSDGAGTGAVFTLEVPLERG